MSESLPALPLGFRAAGLACGIKPSGRDDLFLLVSETPCAAAGVFTTNLVCGAPVKVSRERVPGAAIRAVLINAGNANACTGERGIADARTMTAEAAALLGCRPEEVLVCSTGVIGHFLPMEKLAAGIRRIVPELKATPEAFLGAVRAIMTTDTFPKLSGRELALGGQTVRVTGACKGAAMIAPNMATMLGVIATDAKLTPQQADRLLRHAVDRSFNCISVEGHTSTSDTVFLLANGAAGAGPLSEADLERLAEAIDAVAEELATQIIRDAEGAEHFVTIDVRGLATRDDAARVAKTIAEGPLVKTAITGNDPNWGRIVSAAGYAGPALRESEMSLRLNGTLLYERGAPVAFDAAAVSASMKQGEVQIDLVCGSGPGAVRYWTCDLTAEYVRLNSEYTT